MLPKKKKSPFLQQMKHFSTTKKNSDLFIYSASKTSIVEELSGLFSWFLNN